MNEGKSLITNNTLYIHKPPHKSVPKNIKDVNLTWLINNCYYVISFIKTLKDWTYNMDLEHKGTRGGTIRSRHFGTLEGY